MWFELDVEDLGMGSATNLHEGVILSSYGGLEGGHHGICIVICRGYGQGNDVGGIFSSFGW